MADTKSGEIPNMDESQIFIARLGECARRAGNQNQLAKKAGISQSTIRPYFSGTDVPRRNLLSIAKAAGVSPHWLLTGNGPISENETRPVPAQATTESFAKWLDASFASPQERSILSKLGNINEVRLQEILAGAEPDTAELVGLRHIFMSFGQASFGYEPALSPAESLLLHRGVAEKSIKEGGQIRELAQLTVGQLLETHAFLIDIIRDLGETSQDYLRRRVLDDSMEPSLQERDIAIIRRESEYTRPAVYLLNNGTSEDFVSLVRRDGSIIAFKDNPRFREVCLYTVDPKRHQIVGIVALVVRRMPSEPLDFRAPRARSGRPPNLELIIPPGR